MHVKQKPYRLIFVLPQFATLLVLALNGCSSTIVNHNIHNEVANNVYNKSVKNVLLLPTNIGIFETVAENIREPLPKFASKSNQMLTKATKDYLNTHLGVNIKYSNTQTMRHSLKEYSLLISEVMRSIYKHTNPNSWDIWPHKIRKFDYSIGTGLAFLKKEKIDAVMMMTGSQSIGVFRDNLVFGNLYLHICLIDVSTGNVLWVNDLNYPDMDFRNADSKNQLLSKAFKSFPRQVLMASNPKHDN